MNANRLLPLLLALFMLGGCGREHQDEPRANEAGQEREEAVLRQSKTFVDGGLVKLSLNGEVDEQAMRGLIFDFKDGAQAKPKLKITGSTISVFCVIRSNQPGDQPTFLEIPFAVSGKELDFLGGGITINDYSKFVQDLNPSKARRWYMCGIIGGTPVKDGSGNYTGEVRFSTPSQLTVVNTLNGSGINKSEIPLEVPFTSQWIELEPRNQDGTTERFGGLLGKFKFKPRGSIIRFHPGKNIPGTGGVLHKIGMASESFSPEGSFNLNQMPGSSLDFTFSQPAFHATIQSYNPAYGHGPHSLDAGPEYYYPMWVMPRATQYMGGRGLSLSTTINSAFGGQAVMPTSWPGQSKQMIEGKSYTVQCGVNRHGLPIDFMQIGVHDTGNPVPAGWHIPSLSEMRGVFGGYYSKYMPATQNWYRNRATWVYEQSEQLPAAENLPAQNQNIDVIETRNNQSFEIHGQTLSGFREQWVRWSHTTSVVYALRFMDAYNNQYFSAWRYEWHYPSGTFSVRARYLGPLWADQNLGNYANETWWNSPWGYEIVRNPNRYYWRREIADGVSNHKHLFFNFKTSEPTAINGFQMRWSYYTGKCHIPNLPSQYKQGPLEGDRLNSSLDMLHTFAATPFPTPDGSGGSNPLTLLFMNW